MQRCRDKHTSSLEALFAFWQQHVGSADGPYGAHNTRTNVIVLSLNVIEINLCVALRDYDDVTAETCGRNISCCVGCIVYANVKHVFDLTDFREIRSKSPTSYDHQTES